MTEFTLTEFARKAGKSRKKIEGMVNRGEISSRRTGGRIMIDVVEASRVFPSIDFLKVEEKTETTGDLEIWKERAEAAFKEIELLKKMNELLERQVADLIKDKENLYLMLTQNVSLIPQKTRTVRRDVNGRFIKDETKDTEARKKESPKKPVQPSLF